jgi:hypothetical protein
VPAGSRFLTPAVYSICRCVCNASQAEFPIDLFNSTYSLTIATEEKTNRICVKYALELQIFKDVSPYENDVCTLSDSRVTTNTEFALLACS